MQWNSNDYREHKKLVAQTKVRPFPNKAGNTRPHAMRKWKQLLKQMVIPVERIQEEEGSGDTDDATSSVEDPGEPSHTSLSDMFSSVHTHSLSVPLSLIHSRFPSLSPTPSPAHTRSHGKAKKTKDREPFYKGFGVVYLPGDINVMIV